MSKRLSSQAHVTRLRAAFIAFAIFGLQASSVRAVVTQLTPAGFLVTLDARIEGWPDRVYRALVGQVGEWWDAGHTYSGDSRNLSIDARPGGCFCERLPSGDAILSEQLQPLKRFVETGKSAG